VSNVSSGTRALSLTLVALTCLASVLSMVQQSSAEPYETNTNMTQLPTTRVFPAVFENDGKLYVAGGFFNNPNGGEPASYLLTIYDIETGTTSQGANMIQGAALADYAKGANGLFYVIGGYNASMGGYLTIVQVYNPANDTWWTETSAPVAMGSGSAVATGDGRIVVVGSTTYLNSTLVYNTAAKTWSFGADQPAALWLRNGVLWNSTAIYFLGGRSGSAVAQVDVYNPQTDSWATVAPMLLPSLFGGASVSASGFIYYYCGNSANWVAGSPYDQVQRYDPLTDEWAFSTTTLYPARAGFGLAADAYGRVFLVGGYDGSAGLPTVTMVLTTDVVYDSLAIVDPANGSIVSGAVTVSMSTSNPRFGYATLQVSLDDVPIWNTTSVYGGTTSFVWNTSSLVDGSTHVLKAVGYRWDGSVRQDSVTVTVWMVSVDQRVAQLQADIAALEASLERTDVNLTAMRAQLVALQGQLDSLKTNQTTQSSKLDQLQTQLNDMQTKLNSVKTSSDSVGMYGIVTIVLIIVVLALLAMMFMAGRPPRDVVVEREEVVRSERP
jgi:hypothetical protein